MTWNTTTTGKLPICVYIIHWIASPYKAVVY